MAANCSSKCKTWRNKLLITLDAGPQFWFECGFLNMDAYAQPFFSFLTVWNRTLLWHWWFSTQLLGLHREILTSRWLHENFIVPLLHILSPLDKALVEKPMFMQVGLICTSNLSSGTALQQDFVIKGGMKTLHDEHFGCRPLCLIFFICSDHVWNQSYWSQEYHSSKHSAK